MAFSQLPLQPKTLPNPNLSTGPIVLCDAITPYDLKETFNLTHLKLRSETLTPA